MTIVVVLDDDGGGMMMMSGDEHERVLMLATSIHALREASNINKH